MTYIDIAIIPIAEGQVGAYRKIAEEVRDLWRDHGALDYKECRGDDLDPEMGRGVPELAGLGPEETVIVSMITFEDREHRDEVKAAVMADDRMGAIMGPEGPPFDPERMAAGGFEVMVES